jgi:S-sulfo-L-cysteine synthase (O-acetyl-L-serine-dependent)
MIHNLSTQDVSRGSIPDLRLIPDILTGSDIDRLIGNTPLLRFRRITAHLPVGVEVYAKAEWANPGGSVKDRPALNIIRQAEARGDLHPGVTLLDSTSGNMGIAYAMLGRALGYPVRLVLPENASPERRLILRTYGADLVFSDPAEGSDGARREVERIYRSDPDRYYYANQYNNPDNWQAHYHTTGVEIWQQTVGRVTHFVAGLGTSGTLMGTGRRLREYNPDVELLAVQPDASFHGLEGLKHMPTAIKPGIYDETLVDAVLPVQTEEAQAMCRRLAREEGLLVGVSSGAAMVAALRTAESLEEGVVVTLFPDNASKYLSEPFWTEGD